MEAVRIQNKLKLLFEKIMEPNYVLNSYYADSLINKLHRSDPEMPSYCSMPFVSDLMIEGLNHTDKVHPTVHVFLMRFLSMAASKELHFAKIFFKQGERLHNCYKEINSPNTNPSLRVAAMEVALAIVRHNSGIFWLLETGVWKEILSLCNDKQTVFVVRQTYQFAASFLWRLNDLADMASIKLILSFIMKVFEQYDFLNIQDLSSDEEEELSKVLHPTLHILTAIVSSEGRLEKYSILLDVLTKELKINTHLYVAFDRLRKEDTCFLLAKLILYFVLAKIFLNKPAEPGVKFVFEDFIDLQVTYFNVIQFLVQRRNGMLVLDYCTACNLIIWQVCKNKDSVVASIDNKQIVIRNQMLFMCLVPLIVFVKMGKMDCSTDERLDEYIMKFLSSTCEHTAKAAYTLRSLLEKLDTMNLVVYSVKKLSSLKHHLNNEQANLVFQALFYVLREFDPIDDFGVAKNQQEMNYEDNQERVLVMTYVMDVVLSLLRHHDINWHESLEVICLYSVVYNILQRPNLSTKFVVASLNVITMMVKKFLPPNLSLLLEMKPGSAMDLIGKLIYLKLHDLTWEIRDSALELLLVCTELSYVKFPPFQKQILDNNLINVAAAIAFNDFECYVQVSALKCIGAASKVTAIWDHLKVQYPTIQDQLIAALRNHQEGIVRKEACNVLCDIYQNVKYSPLFKQTLYEHMASSALSDFHWEVQICALKFWRIVFQALLTDQGMLDGTFPPVTFSRETRKIVTLNGAEIQRRLLKILDELASMGLFTVLVKLLDEDTEVDVLESALNLTQEVVDVLDKYKVPEILKPVPGLPETVDELMCHIKEEKDDFEMVDESIAGESTQEAVIEGILNADDINLLSSIYERHMSLQSVKREEVIRPKVKITKVASPYLFLNHMKSKDFKSVLVEKRKWNDGIRSLSSLLDDVLGIYDDNSEVNQLDCY